MGESASVKIKGLILSAIGIGGRILWKFKPLNIMSAEETIHTIIDNKMSIARFGDGEMRIIRGNQNGIGFQKYDKNLSNHLKQVLKSTDNPNCLIGITQMINYNDDRKNLTEFAANFTNVYRRQEAVFWFPYINSNYKYADTGFTRFFIDFADMDYSIRIADKIKKIWDNKKVLIVEGNGTRMGVGNDVFDNAISVSRILCPSKNAYDKFDEILENVREKACDYDIVLIALGPTATCLAYELAKENIQAIDIGHVDYEYECMLANKRRMNIANKYVNEVSGGDEVEACSDEEYLSSIITNID